MISPPNQPTRKATHQHETEKFKEAEVNGVQDQMKEDRYPAEQHPTGEPDCVAKPIIFSTIASMPNAGRQIRVGVLNRRIKTPKRLRFDRELFFFEVKQTACGFTQTTASSLHQPKLRKRRRWRCIYRSG